MRHTPRRRRFGPSRTGGPKARRQRPNGSRKGAKRNKQQLIKAPQKTAGDPPVASAPQTGKPAEKAEQEEAAQAVEKERVQAR